MLADAAAAPVAFATAPLPPVAAFDGGRLTSDGGLPPLAAAEAALGVCAACAACVPEWRRGPARHSRETQARGQGVVALRLLRPIGRDDQQRQRRRPSPSPGSPLAHGPARLPARDRSPAAPMLRPARRAVARACPVIPKRSAPARDQRAIVGARHPLIGGAILPARKDPLGVRSSLTPYGPAGGRGMIHRRCPHTYRGTCRPPQEWAWRRRGGRRARWSRL